MKSTENLERIIKALEKLPDSYETEHALKQNGYVEGVCDSINTVVKLFIHSVSKRYTEKDMDAAYDKGYMDGAHTTSDPY